MNKKFLSAIFAVFSAAILSLSVLSFTGCDEINQGGGEPGKHVVDPNGMGGENILDDGGAINSGESELVCTGIKKEGEHQIILGTDSDYYEFVGTAMRTWSNSGYTVDRVSTGSADAYMIFTLDISQLADVSKVGVMLTLINTRPHTCISVSTDKDSWVDIGWNESNGVEADYKEKITDLRGKKVSDANLYQCYYSLGEYAVQGQPLYIKCGYSDDYNTSRETNGTDVIDYISWFEVFEFVYEWI